MTTRAAAVLVALLCAPLRAEEAPPIDDRHLGDPEAAAFFLRALEEEGRREDGVHVFPLEARPRDAAPRPGYVGGRLLLRDAAGAERPARRARVRLGDSGPWTAVGEDGTFSLRARGRRGLPLRASLDGPRWRLTRMGGGSYEWEAAFVPAEEGAELGDLLPAAGGAGERLGLLHLTLLEAQDYLEREADLSWWDSPLSVRWPGDGDYYFHLFRTITLTEPRYWDVVLHEIGHAVMYGTMRAAHAGGEHYVSRCYSAALAWSEGWATYFASAVRLSRADPGAYLPFMARGVAVENVPGYVCAGETNEWRVAAGLWDLHDLHADGGDRAEHSFREVWEAAKSGPTSSAHDFWGLLSPRLSPERRVLAEAALLQNTLTLEPARPALPAPLTAAPAFE